MKRFALALVVLLPGLLVSTDALAQARPTDAPPAQSTLADCVQLGGHLSVVMAIDESGSLKNQPNQPGTDPDNQRVAGVKAALTGLARLADTSIDGSQPEVEVLLAGFSSVFETAPSFDPGNPDGFVSVTAGSIDRLLAMADQFANRNTGASTDYGAALSGARRALSERAGDLTESGGASPCRALVFFTDGKYDVKGGSAEIERGRQALCERGGITDQLRQDAVVTFTVALSSNIAPGDLGFLQALTDGAGPGCGTTGSPATGLFLSVADRDRLIFLFGDLFNPSPPEQVQVGAPCRSLPCPSSSGSFSVVPGVSRFLIRAATGDEGIGLSLAPPRGRPSLLTVDEPVTSTVPGATLSQRWISPRSVEVEGRIDDADALGTWSFAFLDPAADHPDARPTYTVQLFADVGAELAGTPRFELGEGEQLDLELRGTHGEAVEDGPIAQSAEVRVTITDPSTGAVQEIDAAPADRSGHFSAEVTVPLDTSASHFTVRTEASFPDVDGIEIASQQRTYDIERTLPDLYPRVTPLVLHPSSAEGTDRTSATVSVEGDPRSGGCVWFEIAEPVAPKDARGVAVDMSPDATSDTNCVKVGPGEARRVTVGFQAGHEASGSVNVRVRAHLVSDRNPAPQVVDLEARYELRPTPNVAGEIGIVLLLTLLGLGIPALILHLLNLYAARFERDTWVRARELEVLVEPGGAITSADTGAPVVLGGSDHLTFDRIGLTDERNRYAVVGGIPLRSSASWSRHPRSFHLFRGPLGIAGDGVVPVLTGSVHRDLRSFGPEAEVPLGLTGTWLFTPSEDEPAGLSAAPVDLLAGPSPDADGGVGPVRGRLVLLIADGGGIDQGADVLSAATSALPGLVRGLTVVPQETPGDDEGPDEEEEPRSWRLRLRRPTTDDEPDDDPPPTFGSGSSHDI